MRDLFDVVIITLRYLANRGEVSSMHWIFILRPLLFFIYLRQRAGLLTRYCDSSSAKFAIAGVSRLPVESVTGSLVTV